MTDTPTERGAENIWTRLRRRKVVQWGLVYVAAAWGFLQGLEYVSGLLQWPDQLQKLAGLALLVGLPIALVLAWYHGDRGEQRVRGPELAIITLLFLAGGGLFWWYDRSSDDLTQTGETAPAPAGASVDARPSIAVLPFENRSREADDAFFVDGIHDDILTQLSKVSALKVIARTSVEQFRETKLTTREIGEKLGVTKVLEGGVQRAGNRVRIHVQLIDAATSTHLWAERYDRELTATDIFAIQGEVATAIASALEAALTPAEQARVDAVPTRNLQAWEAYQLGKQRMAKRTIAGLVDAEQFFREAIELDPRFALGYVGLADTLSLQTQYGQYALYSDARWESTLSNAERAVAEALKLDPNLAEAWASAGLAAYYREHVERAESMLRRAVELNPNYAPARNWYFMLLTWVDRPDEALVQIQRAVELDPLSTVINENLAEVLELRGRFHEAHAHYRRAIMIDPFFPRPYLHFAFLNAYVFNRFVDAVPLVQRAMELDSDNAGLFGDLAILYFDLGNDDKLFETTAQATKRWPDDYTIQFPLALVKLIRLDAVGAVRHAQRAVAGDKRYEWGLAILRNADLQSGHYRAALTRYENAYPELFVQGSPRIDSLNVGVAIDLALVLQKRGDIERANRLLDTADAVIRTHHRLSWDGYSIGDVQIHSLRGDRTKALTALRDAEKSGWRGPVWRYHRDFNPNLSSIRSEPEFKAVFADIERDMAKQRARLAARPTDAPLELTDASRRQ